MTLPTVCIVDASTAVTGAFVAARREAQLLRDRARFLLVLPEECAIEEAELSDFAHVVRLPLARPRKTVSDAAFYGPKLLRSGRLLAALLRAHRCERLQVNDYYIMEGAVARLFGYRGRIVTWVRIDPANYGGRIGELWLRAARRASAEIVAVSGFIQRRLPSWTRPRLVYDAAPSAAARPMPETRSFVFVGNFIPGKGQDTAIRAFHMVSPAFPDADLVFHGSDMGLPENRLYLQGLRELAASGDGAGRIRFAGYAQDTSEVLKCAFSALILSRSESFSFTCLEASAHGVPVIATRCGGPEEIVEDGATGLLVPIDNVGAVATAMHRLLEDPERASLMGAPGAELVRTRFGADVFREEVQALLDL